MPTDSERTPELLGLAEAIEAVRAELGRAQDAGRRSDVRFAVGAVDLELAVDARRSAGGEASIKVLSLLSLGARGELAQGETHRVKVTLVPVGEHGKPFEVAAVRRYRPDGDGAE